ncbi:MAG: hypothetical protein ACRELY_27785 [Polyangiaceae bacterium]
MRSPALLFCAALSSGCSMFHAGMAQAPMLGALANDDTGAAIGALDEGMGVERGAEPKELHAFTGLMLADRGTVRLEAGLFHQATDDFRLADKLLDLKDMELDDIMRHTGMPRSMRHGFHMGWLAALNYPYVPRLHERLMLNALAMTAYLDLGDDANARVEARRLDVMIDFATRNSPTTPALKTRAFSGILAGFAFDRGGDSDDALRAYHEAVDQAPSDVSSLVTKIPAAPRGEILIIVAYGLIPRPNGDTAAPGGTVADLLAPSDVAESPQILVDGDSKAGVEVLDLSDVVKADWDQAKKEIGGSTTMLTWAALPSRFVLARIPVAAGTHHVKLSVRGVPLEKDLLVPAGSYAAASLVVMR